MDGAIQVAEAVRLTRRARRSRPIRRSPFLFLDRFQPAGAGFQELVTVVLPFCA